MQITIVEKEGYEADDLLGTIAKKTAAKRAGRFRYQRGQGFIAACGRTH